MHGLGCNIRVYLLFSRRLFWGELVFIGVLVNGSSFSRDTHTHREVLSFEKIHLRIMCFEGQYNI